MRDYYLPGEERFGFITSRMYFIAAQLPLLKKFYNFITDDMLKTRAKRILDVGTGPGDIPLALARLSRVKRKIYAIDPSSEMVGIAKWHAGSDSKTIFSVGSSRHVPFAGKFDIIFTCASYHHWQDKAGSLKYLKRLLNKGGEIRIYESNREKLNWLDRHIVAGHTLDLKPLYKTAGHAGLKISGTHRAGRYIRVSLKPKR